MSEEPILPVLYNTLYVGNLEFTATAQDLIDLLSPIGEVVQVYFPGARTGKPRGYALVQMKSDSDVMSACRALNHQIFQDRTITVAEVRNPMPAVFPWNPQLAGQELA